MSEVQPRTFYIWGVADTSYLLRDLGVSSYGATIQ